ncbi:MAG: hypothetical protein PHP52_14740, partial [Bacteroidales bacterium]|nr:hypothetical protein [Bacteroidales bacterium]
ESIDQFGETICLKEYELGLLQLNNPFPCSDFSVEVKTTPDLVLLMRVFRLVPISMVEHHHIIIIGQ